MSTLGQWLDLIGVAASAVAGALVAGRRQFDWLGVAVIAGVTAIGGGTVRDLLLDRPVFWIANPSYLQAALAATAFTLLYARRRRIPERVLETTDALGLALFGIAGARIAVGLGHDGVIAVVMGVITGSFGGLLRDVLCNDIPMIFRQGQFYATAIILGCSLYVLLIGQGLETNLAAGAGMLAILGLRIAAIVWNLRLPVFRLPPEDR
ncbi:trimeric intracellular cation channel family protein [Stagnimonas aquatica]|uniref:Trimeric intracellular cation channel family protein n=1 Tax=Stagnimonas aquatica TaxID=2689987 RepID=A0A3N0VLC9_9GAMM|nr:trimeric intracellular cation channel family protein [Stagnimonas aquatica]ROH93511.1 trimeric intracellular cation channel family protein [Stagnimonas aquatica]